MKFNSMLINKRQKGYLLVEALCSICIVAFLILALATSFSNTAHIEYALETSQDFRIRQNIQLYEMIAPKVASILPVGGTVVINVDTPNYMTTGEGDFYVNMFGNYEITDAEWNREGLSEPLVISHKIKSVSDLTIGRVGINKYTCDVKISYYDFNKFQQLLIPIDTSKIVTLEGDEQAVFTRGNSKYYDFSFSGEIEPVELKP